MYALFDRVLKTVFTVELQMFPYGVYEQRVFFQRFTRMQDSTSLIIIDIRYADNEYAGAHMSAIYIAEMLRFRSFFGSILNQYAVVRRTGHCGLSPPEGAGDDRMSAK